MIRDKLVPTAREVTHNHNKYTKPYKLLVEETVLAKLEDKKIQLNTVSVKVLNLSGRASTRLKIANIGTIEQLVNCSENTLLNIPHVGITIVEEIKSKLNLYLSEEFNKRDSKLFNNNVADVKRSSHSSSIQESPYSLPNVMSKLLKRLKHERK